MFRSLGLPITFLGLLFQSSLAASGADPNENAALKYWQAFATLPKFSDVEDQLISNCLTAPLDKTVRTLVDNSKYSLDMMQRGAAMRRCEWGMTLEDDGVFALLPYADAGRASGSLACLRARLRFEAGQHADAINDLVAAATLGRHISQDGTLITVLVGYNIERSALEVAAHNLTNLDVPTMKDLDSRLRAMPPFGTPGAAVLATEKSSMEWFMRRVKEAKNKEDLLRFLSWIDSTEEASGKSDGRASRFFEECGGTAEGILQFAETTLPHYDAAAKMFELPLDQFEIAFQRESAEAASNPVFKLFFPAMVKVRYAKARADVRRAQFFAAIAVQLEGPDALKSYPDPVMGEPFEYTRFNEGFELRSKLKNQDGTPVALIIGRHDVPRPKPDSSIGSRG